MSTERSLERLEALLGEIKERVEGLEAKLRPLPTCLTIEEAAARLGVSPSTMKRMIKSGDVHTATINKRSMVPVSELERVATPDTKRPAQAKAATKAAWVPLKKKRAR